MFFEVLKNNSDSNARAGKIKTDHGEIDTPIFMPVGTAGSVKGVHQKELIDDFKGFSALRKTLLANNVAEGIYQYMEEWNLKTKIVS